jgi:hypothetical protein
MKELKDVLRTVPEVEGLVGHEDAGKLMSVNDYDGGNEVKSSLRSAFAKLMSASKEMVSEAISKLISRLNIESKVKLFLHLSWFDLIQFLVALVVVTAIYFVISWRLLATLSQSCSSFMMHLLLVDSCALKRSLGTIFINDIVGPVALFLLYCPRAIKLYRWQNIITKTHEHLKCLKCWLLQRFVCIYTWIAIYIHAFFKKKSNKFLFNSYEKDKFQVYVN